MPLELKRSANRDEQRTLDRKFLRALAGSAKKKDPAEFGVVQLRSTVEARALSAQIITGGGASIAEGFSDALEAALYYADSIRRHAEVVRTETGSDVPWPLTNDTGNEGVILTENSTETEQELTFQQALLRTHKFSSQRVLCPVELIEDSPLLARNLGFLLGLRIGRRQNRAFTVGTGAAQPLGVVNAAAVGATSQNASIIDVADVNALIASIDPAYLGNVRFMCHQLVWEVLSNLSDGSGRPIFPQYSLGRQMQGYPVELNQHMASAITNSAICLLFGDFSRFKIRDCRELRVKSYTEASGLAELDLNAFSAIMRSDGCLLDAGTGSVKSLQQHA